MKPSGNVKIDQVDDRTFRLLMSEVGKDAEGTYKIEAINDYGTATSEAQLDIDRNGETSD